MTNYCDKCHINILDEIPLEGREDEMKYYLKHAYLKINNGDGYLNYNIVAKSLFIADCRHLIKSGFQTQFTEKEIEEIEALGFDLKNFERIEV